MKNRKILVDTNILIYAWDRKERFKQRKAIDALETYKECLYVSTQNLAEFSAVMLKHQCDPDWLHLVIRRYSSVLNVLSQTPNDILNAIKAVKQYEMHYWDAQIWSVAKSNGIDVILTEDGPLGQSIEGVAYINPLIE